MKWKDVLGDVRVGMVTIIVLTGVVIWLLLQFSLQLEIQRLETRDRDLETRRQQATLEVENRFLRELEEHTKADDVRFAEVKDIHNLILQIFREQFPDQQRTPRK